MIACSGHLPLHAMLHDEGWDGDAQSIALYHVMEPHRRLLDRLEVMMGGRPLDWGALSEQMAQGKSDEKGEGRVRDA